MALLISDSSATQGLWPIEEKAHKLMLKDLKTINFKTGIKFRKNILPGATGIVCENQLQGFHCSGLDYTFIETGWTFQSSVIKKGSSVIGKT